MYGSGLAKYKQVNITTASRGQLLVALYEAAIRYSTQAAASIRAGNVVAKGRELQRVSSIVAELTSTLDHSVAPELCKNLEQLYFYMQELLAEANATMNPDPAEEVSKLLRTLLEAWSQAVDVAAAEAPQAAGVPAVAP